MGFSNLNWRDLGNNTYEAVISGYFIAELQKLSDGRWRYSIKGYSRYSHQDDASAPVAETREEAEAGIVRELLRVNSYVTSYVANNIYLA